MQRTEERRGSRQDPLGLRDTGLERESMIVVRCDIKNLIKPSLRFGEATKPHIGKRVLGEQTRCPAAAGVTPKTDSRPPLSAGRPCGSPPGPPAPSGHE